MPTRLNGDVLRQFRSLFHLGTVGDLTDGQLLERYASDRGEAAELAFAALVDRHGPAVLRACRAVLRDEHDAQDAFQATFVVLVRKARSLWVRDSLGPWLVGVAMRAARCARSERSRRRHHEQVAAGMVVESVTPEDDRGDLERALHEEIARLPDRYRHPLVLCDLEGCTQEQAARHLGCPVGTVKSRLARGRGRLRERLARRGLAPAAGLGAAFASEGAIASVPSSLARSTLDAAMRIAAPSAAPGAVPAAVSLLADGVLKAMLLAQLKALAIPALALAVVVGAGVASYGGGPDPGPALASGPLPAPAPQDDVPVVEVERGPLRVVVDAKGNLEAVHPVEVRSSVEGQTTILSILPEGTRVQKGQMVAELDAAPLRDQLVDQQIAAERARADYDNAAKTLEVAGINVKEYLEGVFPQEVKTAEGGITLARSELARARESLDRLRDDDAEDDAIRRAEFDVQWSEFNLIQAEQKLEVLQKYTKLKQLKSLEGDVEKAKADLLAKGSIHQLEKEKEEHLRRMIEACVIDSPSEGMVIYPSSARPGVPRIREGATVRERQIIMAIFDHGSVRVNAKVDEADIDQVAPGQRARVQVHAFPNSTLDGTVGVVYPLPDPANFFDSGKKVYTTLVEIEDGHDGLRPGLSADVQILVAELDDVVRVPVGAVLRRGDADLVAVRAADGSFERREVTLGRSNGEYVEVSEGLEAGEFVAIDPGAVLDEGPAPAEDDPGEREPAFTFFIGAFY